jgi:5'-nucleotidase
MKYIIPFTKPVIINNTAIIQTGEYGRFVGKLNLTSDNGKISFDNYSLIPVDDKIPGDTLVNEMIEKQKELINELILRPNGMDYERKVVESDFVLECNEQGDFENSNLGPLVADAIHSYINNHSAEGTDISMVATGVIRDRIVPGMQSAPDIFRIMSMGSGNDNIPGYPLARLYVTGKELKRILEILQVAYRNTPANYCFYSGVRVEYDPAKGMLKRIKKNRDHQF